MQLVTPEAVVLELETAGIGSRLVALGIDYLVQLSLLVAMIFAFSAAGSVTSGDVGTAAAVVFFFTIFAGRLLYAAVLEAAWRGRTLGKAAMGLRVVTTAGGPVRFRHTIVRSSLGLVEFELTGGAGAFFAALFSRRNQRLGDMAAGTLVVRERTGAATPTAAWFTVPPGLEPYVATLDVSGLSAADQSAVRSFLLRAPSLAGPARTRLALQLAQPIAARVRTQPPDGVGPELFLACVAAAWQQRAGGQPWPAPAPPPPPGTQPPPPPPPPSPPGGGFARPT